LSDKPSLPHLIRRRYRLAEWLGRGSIGLVYRAQDESLDRPVVIKFLEGEESESDERVARNERVVRNEHVARILQEARTVAQLSHPNIAAIYEVGQEQGWEYLVLEYVPGGDLRRLLRQRGGRLTIAEALSLTGSILQALAYAHEQGVVHRDLKPENILLTAAGQVKVADFSLARGEQEARMMPDGMITGTVAYRSPECQRGAAIGPLADLYSLGVVLYELLTARLPFEGENRAVQLNQIHHGSIEPPRTYNTEISPALEQFVLRLAAVDPERRFPSAAAALSELENLRTASRTVLAQGAEPSIVLTGLDSRTVAGSRSMAAEADRRQLAGQVQAQIIDPLKMLLAQAAAFEQTLTAQPASRMAVSVLASLARQVLQQANDLEASLHPAVLETLGLEPALEALAARYERAHSLRLALNLERLPQRPPSAVELALFRLTQDVLETLCAQHILQVALSLGLAEGALRLELTCPAAAFFSEPLQNTALQCIEPFGGKLSLGRLADGQLHLVVQIPLHQVLLFTPREGQILDALVQGWSNKVIASRLTISPRTVNFHLDHIFAKLGVHTRTEAVVIALRQGWARRPSQIASPG
jgi:serine/threonine protein kinase/DNA-binding CsgD family transcriptional regulator